MGGDKNNIDSDKVDILSMDVPLFIRLLEYAKEDAKTDLDLHVVTENAVARSKHNGALTMDDYWTIINGRHIMAGGGAAEELSGRKLNSFHDWLIFESPEKDAHRQVLDALKYTSPSAPDNYLRRVYPNYEKKFKKYMEENPNAFYGDGGSAKSMPSDGIDWLITGREFNF